MGKSKSNIEDRVRSLETGLDDIKVAIDGIFYILKEEEKKQQNTKTEKKQQNTKTEEKQQNTKTEEKQQNTKTTKYKVLAISTAIIGSISAAGYQIYKAIK